MAGIPYDLILDILSRLPVKTVCKFRCVSKAWCNLISDPCFLHLHRDRSKRNLHYLFVSSSHEHRDKARNKKDNCSTFHFTTTDSEGRVLKVFTEKTEEKWVLGVLPSRSNLICFNSFERIYICNPATQELLTLPNGSPSVECVQIGFGYVPSREEYKVVRIFCRYMGYNGYDNGDYDIGCEIFTVNGGEGGGSHTNSWRVIEEKCPYPVYGCPPFVNGALHWMIHPECCTAGYDEFIVSFDMERENFRIIPHPEDFVDILNPSIYLMELRGMLCIVDDKFLDLDSTILVWMLKDYDNRIWAKEYSINLAAMDPGVPFLDNIILMDIRNGEILMNSSCERLDYYNIENKSFRRMEKPKPAPKFGFYWESFVSLGSR